MNISLLHVYYWFQLIFAEDNKHYIVEDITSGEFYEMPEVCIEAIKLIEKGEKLGRD